MGQDSLARRIQQRLAEQADIHIVVAQQQDVLLLSGRVRSAEERQIAEQIVSRMAPDQRIENNLDVERFLPMGSEGNGALIQDEVSDDEIPVSLTGFEQEGVEIEADTSRLPLETNEINVVDPDVRDDDEPEEPEPAFFPSTDPVITANAQGTIDVLGGFAASSTNGIHVKHSAEDDRPGDEALADAIRRELREDALTTDLSIDVEVLAGVARLRGTVPDLTDAENAEEVANRIAEVREVIDDLTISSM